MCLAEFDRLSQHLTDDYNRLTTSTSERFLFIIGNIMSKIKSKCDLIVSLTKDALTISQPTEEVVFDITMGEPSITDYLASNILDTTTTIVLNINGGTPQSLATDGRYVNETDSITCWIARKGAEPTNFPGILLDIREEMVNAIESNVMKFEQLNQIGIGGWFAKKYSGETWVLEFEIF